MKTVKFYLLLVLIAPLFSSVLMSQVAITAATGAANLSADNAANATTPAFTSLGNIIITEVDKADFAAGASKTLILTAPAGWAFQAGTGSATAAAGGNLTVNSTTVTT